MTLRPQDLGRRPVGARGGGGLELAEPPACCPQALALLGDVLAGEVEAALQRVVLHAGAVPAPGRSHLAAQLLALEQSTAGLEPAAAVPGEALVLLAQVCHGREAHPALVVEAAQVVESGHGSSPSVPVAVALGH